MRFQLFPRSVNHLHHSKVQNKLVNHAIIAYHVIIVNRQHFPITESNIILCKHKIDETLTNTLWRSVGNVEVKTRYVCKTQMPQQQQSTYKAKITMSYILTPSHRVGLGCLEDLRPFEWYFSQIATWKQKMPYLWKRCSETRFWTLDSLLCMWRA